MVQVESPYRYNSSKIELIPHHFGSRGRPWPNPVTIVVSNGDLFTLVLFSESSNSLSKGAVREMVPSILEATLGLSFMYPAAGSLRFLVG